MSAPTGAAGHPAGGAPCRRQQPWRAPGYAGLATRTQRGCAQALTVKRLAIAVTRARPLATRFFQVTLFDDLGGEPVLRSIVNRFVDRMFEDPMIGFFFRKANRQRVKQKEYELAAEHLGGGVTYTGRPLAQAHAAHSIMGGQFARRLELLRSTLVEAGAPASVIEHWIAYTENARALVTRDARGECIGLVAGAGAPAAPPSSKPSPAGGRKGSM